MLDNIRYLAADPTLINTSKAVALGRTLFTVLLVFVAIGLISLARKGKISELLIAMVCIVIVSMVVFQPGIVQTVGNSLSGLFTK